MLLKEQKNITFTEKAEKTELINALLLPVIQQNIRTGSANPTKHITILSLKYLFLYIKSGRKTFNNHDITSLILKDIHFPSITRKAIKDREKSIIE